MKIKVNLYLLIVMVFCLNSLRGDFSRVYEKNWNRWQTLNLEEKKNLVENYRKWKTLPKKEREVLKREWREIGKDGIRKKELVSQFQEYQSLPEKRRKLLEQKLRIFRSLSAELRETLPSSVLERWKDLSTQEKLTHLKEFLKKHVQKKREERMALLPEPYRKKLEKSGPLNRAKIRLRLFTLVRTLGQEWMGAHPQKWLPFIELPPGKFWRKALELRGERFSSHLQKSLTPKERETLRRELLPYFPELKKLEDFPRLWQNLPQNQKREKILQILQSFLKPSKK